jgi:mono/diheme cytochrome c family protein
MLLLAVFARRVIQLRGPARTPRGALASPAAPSAKPPAAEINTPVKRGEAVFYKQCSVCHTADTDEVIIGPSLNGYFSHAPSKLSNGSLFPRTDTAIRELLVKGTRDMPPMIQDLSEPQIADLLAYLHSL